ncbi:MAG: DUF4160 domain-containing protein, partial [Odoribacter sp.]|nr:DUF4160 domain-containing protein [Odoribacter sp.]
PDCRFHRSFGPVVDYLLVPKKLKAPQGLILKGELPRRALNLVYEWLDLHKDELMENWRRLASFELPKPIKPLE